MHNFDALLNAIRFSTKPITLLVGAPVSCCRSEKASIPDVAGMTELAKEYIKELDLRLYADLEKHLEGKVGSQLYQTCLEWIQSNVNQDAVNEIIKRATCLPVFGPGKCESLLKFKLHSSVSGYGMLLRTRLGSDFPVTSGA